jgi:hypothetical protein
MRIVEQQQKTWPPGLEGYQMMVFLSILMIALHDLLRAHYIIRRP